MMIIMSSEVMFTEKDVKYILTKSALKIYIQGFIIGFVFAYMVFSVIH